ncbi:ankyrin repeat domain-containing protein [Persicitalea sp.]|uniref:ankyrin repeat domain-containing protein n=1 Tax=Persicitalea sp. TaxID=3100273 RepID=UPI0035938CA5
MIYNVYPFLNKNQKFVMTAIMNAINKNDASLVQQLIQDGVDVNELDSHQDAPLVMAAYKGHHQIVRQLLEAGADVHALDPSMKATALHAAAYAGRTEAAKVLIEYGIDIDRQGPYNGYTALHDAIWQNNIEVVKVLLQADADLSIISNDGKSALDFAKSKGHKEIVALIESKSEK